MKKKSNEIALSAVACALSTIALTVGTLYSPMLFTGYLLGCLFLFLPLSQKYYKGAILCFFATNVLTLLFNGFNFYDTLPYTLFFGLHPIINEWQLNLHQRKTESAKTADTDKTSAEQVSEKQPTGNEEDFVIDWDAPPVVSPTGNDVGKGKHGDKKKCRVTWIDVIFTLVKICWFDAAMYFLWKVVFSANTTIAFVDAHIVPVILIGGSLFFLLYDVWMFFMRKKTGVILARYLKKK